MSSTLQFLFDVIRGKRELIDSNKHIPRLMIGYRFLYQASDACDIIKEHLAAGTPQMICRFGTLELDTMRMMLKSRDGNPKYTKWHKEWFTNTAGFFPTDDYNMTRFACEHLDLLKDIDVMSCRSDRYEIKVIEKYLQFADLVSISAISYPFLYENPWSAALKGKRVLVIHPFEDTIKSQYAKRENLFKNPEVLPEFDLLTYKPVQGIGNSKKYLKFKTWFEALAAMKEDIKYMDFDIALIGAGAYGIFLAQYVKSLGKQAIHMGGATQLLFGISGKRWDNWFCDLYYNEYWTRPSLSETPEGVELFEHGTMAYW